MRQIQSLQVGTTVGPDSEVKHATMDIGLLATCAALGATRKKTAEA
jgi:hypothetical protein